MPPSPPNMTFSKRRLPPPTVKRNRDEQFITAVNNRISAIYEQVIATQVYKTYEAAQNAVNELMQQVNATIQYEVTGQTPCTHDCSTCGGCH